MRNNVIKSKPFLKQPFVVKQFAYKHKMRGYNPLSFCVMLWKILTERFWGTKKDNTSYMLDHLLIGSNGLVNLLLLKKINDLAVKENKKFSVGIFEPKEKDYWYYELVNKDEKIADSFCVQLGIDKQKRINFGRLIQDIKDKNIFSNIKIVYVDNRYKIDYLEYDEYTNNWFLYFNNKKLTVPEVSEFIEFQNQIKDNLNNEIKINLFKNDMAKQLVWFRKKGNVGRKEFNSPILISKNLILSSLPQGWCELNHEIQQDGSVKYKNKYNIKSFGTANSICSNGELFKKHTMRDVEEFDVLFENNKKIEVDK